MVTFFRYWGPVCGYAGLIFYLSAQSHPETQVPFITHVSDKVLHAFEYAVFGALCYRALRESGSDWWRQHAIPVAIVLASLYGVSDEIHQAFVPFRNSSWLDWLADTVGAVLGTIAMHRMASLRPMRSIPEALP